MAPAEPGRLGQTMISEPLHITAVGMACPVGLDASSACAAIRASIVRFRELPYLDNKGRAIIGSYVAPLPFELRRRERLVELLALALEDGIRNAPELNLERTPLLVGTAEPERPGGGEMAERLIPALEHRLQRRFHPKLSRVIAEGNSAGFRAVEEARHLIRRRSVSACLVCGVDSHINSRTLLWLEENQRLKTEDDSDGIIPGEAAACVVVEACTSSRSRAQSVLLGLGFGHEPAHLLSGKPLRGVGLASAARTALTEAGLELHQIDFRISDAAGEHYSFKEQTLVLTRLLMERREKFPIWLCAETLGDTGAAVGICQLIMATRAFQRGYAPGKRTICQTSSVPGTRAVAILQHPK